ncbi:hypothetical protein HBI56_223210 [Parastagonospora nodorum]|uniref:Uncharacterized protein n=1 Tax=Phaeosphaeria nodorum (strain SN15 / ATCC MYA-4574 / FGSC 10173) TaxID=321614 RepID=A0A7U2HZR0_PHANO|nr:hypothetical protein HBH56_147780 [Parastagonospora nodorum]QRC94062.1 hypothetical protein JI435_405110 [Parastagonospora nodorum SN15]KAH3923208.1 hypothetical protein HBH54_212420 [Parastagonospora nodorum]KAH3945858.1 hypothetical protein HBH53_135240 [Parastagonospora nodorum]KAH3984169.1 hypothetical protein HBH52_064800 [Parastagonospora nodorum]
MQEASFHTPKQSENHVGRIASSFTEAANNINYAPTNRIHQHQFSQASIQ